MTTQLSIKPAQAFFVFLFTLFAINTKASASLITSIFINEIHYDNVSGDTGEFIELAGRAGIELHDWAIYFYNGANNKVYKTIDISSPFIFTDMENGFGFYSIQVAGIQNGPNDAIALVDGSGSVAQFLSYEGDILAQDGPAKGKSSTDIGVYEPHNTPIGYSLQLTGSGNQYQDFSWQLLPNASLGQVNYQQRFLLPTSQLIEVPEPTTITLFFLAFMLICYQQMHFLKITTKLRVLY